MADKAWAVKVGERWVQVQDLPVEALERVADENRVSWLDVIAAPARDAGIAKAVLAEACRHVGAETPTGLSGRTLLGMFELVDDDMPSEFTNGIPPEGADR